MQDIILFIQHHLTLSLAAAVIFVLLLIIELLRAKRNNLMVDPKHMTQLINHHHAIVIDIRSKDIFSKGHVIDAMNIAANELKETSKKLEKFKSKPIIIVCVSGMEAQKVAATLLKQGYNAFGLSGGMRAWVSADMPVIKES